MKTQNEDEIVYDPNPDVHALRKELCEIKGALMEAEWKLELYKEWLHDAVEERPKGKWKCFIGSAYYGVDEDNEPIWRERKIYHCSFCNRRTVIKENFCPSCGAQMEAEA